MAGDMGHMGGLISPYTELFFQIPVGLPSLERGRRVKKGPLAQSKLGTPRKTSQNGEQMAGDMGHMGGLISPDTELFFQIPVGLPSLERGRRVKKGPLAQS